MVSKIRYARPTSQRASLTLSRSADQAILNNEVNCPANFTLSSGDQRAEACRTLTQKVKAFPLVTNQRRMLASARSPGTTTRARFDLITRACVMARGDSFSLARSTNETLALRIDARARVPHVYS